MIEWSKGDLQTLKIIFEFVATWKIFPPVTRTQKKKNISELIKERREMKRKTDEKECLNAFDIATFIWGWRLWWCIQMCVHDMKAQQTLHNRVKCIFIIFIFISFCSTFSLASFLFIIHRHHNPIYGMFLYFSLILLFVCCLFFILVKMQILQLSGTKYCLTDRVGLCQENAYLLLTGSLQLKSIWIL